jgi:peptide/nickel transport system permease protein
VSRFPTPVADLIGGALGWTVLLAGVSVVISFTLGAALGLAAAWRGGAFDTVVAPALTLLGAFPYFWLAMVALQVFGFGLGWFPLRHAWDTSVMPGWTPAFVWGVARHAALPALTLVAASVGGWMLGFRNSARAVLAHDHVLLARARGLPTARVIGAYVLRNALLPHLTGFGMALGFVVPLLQGLVLAITLAVLLANALVDLLNLVVDPRTRTA